MKKFNDYAKIFSGRNFLFCLLIFLLPFFFQSCESEKDIGASLDDFNLVHTGDSYPSASYDDGAYFFNCFVEWLCDFSFFEDNANDYDKQAYTDRMSFFTKFQFIGKGSQNKYANGKTVTRLGYIEVPLYVLYQHKIKSGGKIFGGAGPYSAYALFGKIKSTTNGQTNSMSAFSQAGGYKQFDMGLALLAGYKAPMGVGVSLDYETGLVNIAKSNAGGDKIKNRGFSLNFSYDLNKILKK